MQDPAGEFKTLRPPTASGVGPGSTCDPEAGDRNICPMSAFGPDDWSIHYRNGVTPWDLGEAHPELVRRLSSLGTPGTAIVPGAGRGHDAAALAAAGWRVTAIDYAPEVAALLEAAVGHEGRVVTGDAFDFAPPQPVDLLFDHTFFCTLPPEARAGFGVWAREAVKPGGRLASVVFPIDRPATATCSTFASRVTPPCSVRLRQHQCWRHRYLRSICTGRSTRRAPGFDRQSGPSRRL